MSVVLHEVSHGYAALWYGDQTALRAGRLTLNPIKHLDLMGSVIVPVFLVLVHSPFPFGWARPVPYNVNNLRDPKWGTFFVAIAGVATNFAIAIIFAIFIRIAPLLGLPAYDYLNPHPFYVIATAVIIINIALGIFNLIPVPPLDGSKVLFSLMPARLRYIENFAEKYALALVAVFILIVWNFDFISPIVGSLFSLLTGLH